MVAIIDLAPGADENALAVEISDRLRQRLATDGKRLADFRAMRASILLVAQDIGESVTLRFDHGRVTVYDGNVGIPSVTFCGEAAALRRLYDFPLTRWLRIPRVTPFTRSGRETWDMLKALFSREDLKIYGFLAHPRTLLYFLRVLSSRGG